MDYWELVERLRRDGHVWAAAVPFSLVLLLLFTGFGALSIAVCLCSLAAGLQLANWLSLDSDGHFLSPLVERWMGADETNSTVLTEKQDSSKEKSKPWHGLTLPTLLNEALEGLLDQIVDQYVNNWYASGISRDRAFLNEIRYQLRFACASLARRLSSIDLAAVVAEEAVPAATLHVHRIAAIENRLEDKNIPLSLAENMICDQLNDLHYAMGSRQHEVNYLRQLADSLLPYLLDESRLAGRAHDDDSPAKHGGAARPTRAWPSHSARHFLRELLVNSILLPLLDLIADPDTINHLIIFSFDTHSDLLSNSQQSARVPFLRGLTDVTVDGVPDSLLQLKLSEVLRDARQFSMFRLYLQDIRGPVNELNFLAETTRIHESMQRKEESDSQISYDIWQLFGQFIHESAPDRVFLETAIIDEFRTAIESHDVQQLDTVVEKSYQIIYQRMQSEHVIPFCQSDSFLGYLCGSPPVSVIELIDKPVIQRKSSTTERAISFNLFRSQLRRLLTLSTEGSAEGDEAVTEEYAMDPVDVTNREQSRGYGIHDVGLGNNVSEEADLVVSTVGTHPPLGPAHSQSLPQLSIPSIDVIDDDDVSPSGGNTDDDSISVSSAAAVEVEAEPTVVMDRETRNMNQWRVSIGKIIPTRDNVTGRTIYVYVIDIERTEAKDHETKQWSIYRRFSEFYVLESKLVEFHRDALRFSSLPPRKTFVNRNRAYMEQHRLVFAAFLSSLCKQKLLYRSDLLSAFLTSPEEFRDSVMLSDLNPWKVVKKMPGKLSREKGQNLRPFLLNMLAQTLSPPTAPDGGPTSSFREKVDVVNSESSSLSSLSAAGELACPSLYSPVFGNNCLGGRIGDTTTVSRQQWTRSCLDSLLLLAHSLMSPASRWFFNLLASLRLLCRHTLDTIFLRLLRLLFFQVSSESTLLALVQLIQQSLFYSNNLVATDQEKSLREQLAKRRVLEFLQDEIPSHISRVIGRSSLRGGAKQLVHSLQYPRLNKHLSYRLIDILYDRLFSTSSL